MLITEITSEECREILAKTGFGHPGCSHNNEPYVLPMYFAYETDYLYGFSTFGRKIDWMRTNPRLCVEVDEIASHSSWASVIINGLYQELPNTPQHSSERRHGTACSKSVRSGGRPLKRRGNYEQRNPFLLSSTAFTSTP